MRVSILRQPFLAVALFLSACGGSGGGAGGEGGPFTGAASETPCSAHSDPRLQSMSDEGIGFASQLGLAAGRYALPATPVPTQLVVMFHGNHNSSCSWRNHLRSAAARGVVAVAMDYTGQETRGEIENYGWFMRAGAADSIAAAQHFLQRFPTIDQVFVMSVSMGANAAGVAIASPDAVRADGSPLFDYWVAVEGVHNLTEEYFIARSVAPVNAGGAVAQQEMEEENGGAFEEVPDRYVEITNVLRVQDMTALEGAVMVHGVDDGLVPTWQSREMNVALNLVGVPSHMYTVGGNGGGEDGTTASGIIAGPLFAAAGEQYESPLAGHGWEGSETHLVITTGFDQLYALMEGATVMPGETAVPGF